MKKILSLLLTLVLIFSFTSCALFEKIFPSREEPEAENAIIVEFANMYKASKPNKIIGTAVQTFGDKQLTSEYILTKGEVLGKEAIVYEKTYTEMLDATEGATAIAIPAFATKNQKIEYLEGMGVRYDNGLWEKNNTSFTVGQINLNFYSKIIGDRYTHDGNVLTFTVLAADTGKLFGEGNEVDADVYVKVVTDGSWVKSIAIDYTIAAHQLDTGKVDSNGEPIIIDIPDNVVDIDVIYEYDLQYITIE